MKSVFATVKWIRLTDWTSMLKKLKPLSNKCSSSDIISFIKTERVKTLVKSAFCKWLPKAFLINVFKPLSLWIVHNLLDC